MIAAHMLQKFGASLVGRRIQTEKIGEWPGGPAVITQITPDLGATEIAFEVQHETWRSTKCRMGKIGIFVWEEVAFLP